MKTRNGVWRDGTGWPRWLQALQVRVALHPWALALQPLNCWPHWPRISRSNPPHPDPLKWGPTPFTSPKSLKANKEKHVFIEITFVYDITEAKAPFSQEKEIQSWAWRAQRASSYSDHRILCLRCFLRSLNGPASSPSDSQGPEEKWRVSEYWPCKYKTTGSHQIKHKRSSKP